MSWCLGVFVFYFHHKITKSTKERLCYPSGLRGDLALRLVWGFYREAREERKVFPCDPRVLFGPYSKLQFQFFLDALDQVCLFLLGQERGFGGGHDALLERVH